MSLLNLLDDKRISIGVNVYIAWVIATLLYLQQGTAPVINLSPVDLVLQAGLIYGYYRTVFILVILILSPFLFFGGILQIFEGMANRGKAKGTKESNTLTSMNKSVIGITFRLSEVIAIAVVFIYHPENLVYSFAPIGLVLVLLFYVLNNNDKQDKPVANSNSQESPTYVEVVNSNIKVSNSEFEPLFIDFSPRYSVNSKNYGLPIHIVNTKDPLPVQVENSSLDVEVKNYSSVPVKITESQSSLSVNVVNDVGIKNDHFNSPVSVELVNNKKSPLPVEVMNVVNTKQDESS